ncbi:hypothetical protein KEU06_09700 [Pseudaminobacter sp. 19-2017]|uniref:Uncharacterized protein n=1 Tax=Pseudaminobacter soli (ex Zhang et al. 2022) TaxID=2831468 RepID=A0A942E0Z1_9HYPH|nr:hypothetical protein [Pseudaminobacter soli]MBS3648880.1 hypothetical protein [Pseudaminobacter soli]
MAFKTRLEFWRLSTTDDGVKTVVLDEPIADSIEIDANMADPIELPVLVNREAYGVSIYGVAGNATVEITETPTKSPLRGRLIVEGSQHWIIAKGGKSVFITEYV